MQEVANPKPYGKKNGFYHDYTNISDFPAGGSKNETVPPNHEGSKPAVSSHRSHRNYTVAVGKRIGVYRINENYNKTEPNLDLTEEYGDGAATKLTEFDKLDKQKSLVSISTVSSGTTETVRTSSSFNNFSSSVSTKRNTTTQRVEVNGDSFLQRPQVDYKDRYVEGYFHILVIVDATFLLITCLAFFVVLRNAEH
ncbi:unnamed protein product [Enterobius vermicularis]|uniref:Uncharacterized protein n=1 Tax=Enterobius vermicularis TaxID=51028 RepID=A0A0N4VF11_ENTVE|nr:unnamed protein product [Enterobius vermicularis]